MTKLDIVYCRVSTDEQVSNNSLELQEQTCKVSIERIFNDANILIIREDYSGFEESRPELDKIRQMITEGKVRSFTALRVDRLCRKSGVLERIRDGYFKPYGVRVFTVNDLGEWLWNPMHESMQESMAVFASSWGKLAVQNMHENKLRSIERGNIICCGIPPYGLVEVIERDSKGKRISATLDFDEDESKVVIRIFENLVNDKLSVNKIATLLNEDGIPTLTQSRGKSPYHVRQSSSVHQWRTSTVRHIIRNKVYSGIWTYGKKKNTKVNDKNGKVISNSRDGIIEVAIPALIPADIWDEAQKILDKNRVEKRGREVTHEYALSKHIKCECGFRMVAYTVNGKYQYYKCPNGVYGGECDTKNIKAGLADDISFNWLHNLLSNKALLRSKIEDYVSEKEKVIAPLKRRLETIDKLLDKKNAEHDAMISSYMRLPEIAQAKVLANIETIEESIKEHSSEADNIRKEIKRHAMTVMLIKAYISPIGETWASDQGITPNLFPEMSHIDKLKAGTNEPLSYAEKRRYIEDFDLQATILTIEGVKHIRLVCTIGSDVLPLLGRSSGGTVSIVRVLRCWAMAPKSVRTIRSD